MSEEGKSLTEAEKQIRRLEALRTRKESPASQAPSLKASFQPKTAVEKTIANLQSLRDRLEEPSGRKGAGRIRIEGRQKSSKLTSAQIQALEELARRDKRLSGSRVIRIALNRLLDLEQAPGETELENLIREIAAGLRRP